MVASTQLATLRKHIEAERAHDLDAVMTTMTEKPRYVVPHYILESREAVRAMYEIAKPFLTSENLDEYLRALDDPKVCSFGSDHIVIEYTDDFPLHAGMVVVVHFEGDLIVGENTYATRPGRLTQTLGDKFERVSGVRRLSES